jgi:hypothetical protein
MTALRIVTAVCGCKLKYNFISDRLAQLKLIFIPPTVSPLAFGLCDGSECPEQRAAPQQADP